MHGRYISTSTTTDTTRPYTPGRKIPKFLPKPPPRQVLHYILQDCSIRDPPDRGHPPRSTAPGHISGAGTRAPTELATARKRTTEATSNLVSKLPDEGIGRGVLVILRSGIGGRRRVESLAAGVDDEGVALIDKAEAAVLVHGSLPRACQERSRRDGDGEQAEADGRRGGHEAERWSSEAGSGVSEVEPRLGCAQGGQKRNTSQRCCRRGGVRVSAAVGEKQRAGRTMNLSSLVIPFYVRTSTVLQ
jgi:hypothetical protein